MGRSGNNRGEVEKKRGDFIEYNEPWGEWGDFNP